MEKSMPAEKGYTLWSRNGDDSECDDTELIKMWDDSMDLFMEEMKKKKAGSAAKSEWNVGDFCRAKYRLDGQWYEAEVVKKLPQKRVMVEFIGYGDHEELDSCMLRASKGQACRELQKEEVLLAQFEDEEDSDESEENQEKELDMKKENHVVMSKDQKGFPGNTELRNLQEKKPTEFEGFVSPRASEPREKNKTPTTTPMSTYTSTEQKEEEEISALRKKSIQNRRLKSVSRSGGEPYSVPEGNHVGAQTTMQRGLNTYISPKEPFMSHSEPQSHMSRSEPQPYMSRSEPQPYASRSEPQPYTSRCEPEPYMPRSEQFPYGPQPYGSRPSDFGRPDMGTARSFDQTAAEIKEMINKLSQKNVMFSSRGPWESNPPPPPPSSFLPPPPSYGRHRGAPDIMPPLPAGFPGSPFQAPHASDDTESLTALLNSWYINGYNTGYYMGLRNGRQDLQRHSTRNHT